MRSLLNAAMFGAILVCAQISSADVQYTKLYDFGKVPDFDTYSRDCQYCGVILHKDGKEIMVIDGVPQAPYEMVGNLAFSADGNHYGYCGRNFVGGNEVPELTRRIDNHPSDALDRFLDRCLRKADQHDFLQAVLRNIRFDFTTR